MTDSLAQDLTGGPLVAALSNEFVRLFRTHYGRGPTQTRTVIVEDMIICRMTDPFTTAERTMIDLGHYDDVSRLRSVVQERLRDDFARIIENLTHRKVLAHVSGVHADPDMCVSVFIVETPSED